MNMCVCMYYLCRCLSWGSNNAVLQNTCCISPVSLCLSTRKSAKKEKCIHLFWHLCKCIGMSGIFQHIFFLVATLLCPCVEHHTHIYTRWLKNSLNDLRIIIDRLFMFTLLCVLIYWELLTLQGLWRPR